MAERDQTTVNHKIDAFSELYRQHLTENTSGSFTAFEFIDGALMLLEGLRRKEITPDEPSIAIALSSMTHDDCLEIAGALPSIAVSVTGKPNFAGQVGKQLSRAALLYSNKNAIPDVVRRIGFRR